jgi:hypothetical protein
LFILKIKISPIQRFGDMSDEIKRTELVLFRSQFGHITILMLENKGFLKALGISNPICPLLRRSEKQPITLGYISAAQSIQVSPSQEDTHNF